MLKLLRRCDGTVGSNNAESTVCMNGAERQAVSSSTQNKKNNRKCFRIVETTLLLRGTYPLSRRQDHPLHNRDSKRMLRMYLSHQTQTQLYYDAITFFSVNKRKRRRREGSALWCDL